MRVFLPSTKSSRTSTRSFTASAWNPSCGSILSNCVRRAIFSSRRDTSISVRKAWARCSLPKELNEGSIHKGPRTGFAGADHLLGVLQGAEIYQQWRSLPGSGSSGYDGVHNGQAMGLLGADDIGVR